MGILLPGDIVERTDPARSRTGTKSTAEALVEPTGEADEMTDESDDQALKSQASGALKAGFVYLGVLFVVIIVAVLWYIGIF